MKDRMPEIVTRETVDPVGRHITTEAIDIGEKDLERIFAELGSMAQSHIDASNGALVSIDAPDHLAFHTMADPIPTEDIEPTANAADRRNPAIQAAIDDALGRRPYVIPSIYESIREGYNVGISFSHNVVQDVPLGFGAILGRFGRYEHYRRDQGDPELKIRRGMMIGQMLKRVGIVIRNEDNRLVIPADHVMTMLADDVWSSITTGRSSHGLRKSMPGVTKDSNEAVKTSVKDRQDAGGLVLAGSLSGSTMKPVEGEPDTFAMDGVTDSTMSIATHEMTRWLFVALLIEPEGVRAEFSGESEGARPGELRTLRDESEVNAALHGLAQTATAISPVEGRKIIYVPKKHGRIRDLVG